VGTTPRALPEKSFPVQTPDHFSLILLFFLRFLGRKLPLTPIIPVHPGNSPVSPIIPVHTQKQGGGGIFLFHLPPSLPSLPFPAHLPLSPTIPALTGTSPVSPIVPALTQTPGGGGHTTPFLLRHGQLLPYESHQSQYVPLHYVSMSARRHFGVRRLAAAFAVDRGAPYSLFRRNGLRRKSGSKLPHSKASFRQHDRMSLWSYR